MGAGQSQALNEQVSKANAMAQQASDALICGPDCQKINTEASLFQKYQDAIANVASAPVQLIQAEKLYYTFKSGTAGYITFLDAKIETLSETIKGNIQTGFDTQIADLRSLNKTYDTLFANNSNMIEFDNKLKDEDKNITDHNKSLSADLITNDRKSFYEMQGYDNLSGWYKSFLWIYAILLVAFLIAIGVVKSGYSYKQKFIILFLLMLYPFVIDFVVIFIVNQVKNLYSFIIKKNIHNNLYKSEHKQGGDNHDGYNYQ